MSRRHRATPGIPLSEENLRIHNSACPKVGNRACSKLELTRNEKADGYYQINLIRQERAAAREQETFRQMFEHREDGDDADFDPDEAAVEIRREESLEALRLYKGPLASSESPMGRFLAMGPTHDSQAWMAKATMEESGVDCGDLEALDLRKLASEMMEDGPAGQPEGTRQATTGSLQASSDTLTAQLQNDRRRRETTRIRKRIVMRRHKTGDGGAPSRGVEN